MTSVAILQARTNSSRLPGKVLLPIKGMPVVVLAAKRAANTGRNVLVVTSQESSDDGLAALAQKYGLKCFRGSLENTLDRVVNALFSYDDNTIVFRLTADNVIPDGALLDEVEREFLDKGLEYLCCNGEPSGLPYGMSVEVMRLSHLREAASESTSDYDQEHVTPYVIRKFGATYFQKYTYLRKGHFRCTIDCIDDYFAIQKIFSDVDDPVQEPSFALVNRLEEAPFHPIASSPTPKLVLGTAQLGSHYGIANTTFQPNKIQCQELIKTAISNGVIYLDTARAYGESEAMIGYSLKNGWAGRAKIITKLSSLDGCPRDASLPTLRAFVSSSVFQSCTALGLQTIDVLMLHRASHLHAWSGGVWEQLLDLQSSGYIRELGVSVQNPEELSKALAIPAIHYIQLPYNLLDWRWDVIIPEILATKNSRKLTIHARSTLLQGLLPSVNDKHWHVAHVEQPSYVIEWLTKQVANCQRDSVVDLCLSYVNALTWVDGIVVGMDNMSQLIKNINYFNLLPLSAAQSEVIQNTRPKLSESTLNPALWRKKYP